MKSQIPLFNYSHSSRQGKGVSVVKLSQGKRAVGNLLGKKGSGHSAGKEG